jgi:hypothetical protein
MKDGDYIKHAAREMIERFGAGAAHIARKLAEVSNEVQDDALTSVEIWKEIANAIEREIAESPILSIRRRCD